MKVTVDPKILFEAGAHLGHQTKRWNPKMGEYIYGSEKDVHIIDLTKTVSALEEVLVFLQSVKTSGKKIIFVGTKKQAKEKVREIAEATGNYYVNERWLGGTLTNFDQMKRTLKNLEDLNSKKASGYFSRYTKKEKLLIDRQIERTEKLFGGLKGIDKLPEVIFTTDAKKEKGALTEAKKRGITTISVVDTNCDPTLADYVIPMNDDAVKAINYLCELIIKALS